MKPNLALAVVLLTSVLIIVLLLGKRRWFLARTGPQGYILLWGFVASFLAPANSWLLGVSSLFNDQANPNMGGMGGYYGLNYAYYPQAMVIFLVTPLIAIVLTTLVPRKRGFHADTNIVMQIGNGLRLDRITNFTLISVVLLVAYYFHIVGWERLWHSDLGRFEYVSASQGDVDRGALGGKIAITFVLAFGCASAALTVFPGVFWTATLAVIVSALPFCAFASRGISVLFAAYAVAVFIKVPSRRRWLVILPLLVGLYFSLRLPLVMRGTGQTGLRVAIETLFAPEQKQEDGFTANLLNIGQGFALLSEEREAATSGASITRGVPLKYYLLSVSPTVSFIDGFSQNWVEFNPRYNEYTPYSGLCELISLNLFLGILIPPVVFLFAILLCRRMSGRSLWHDAGLYGFVLIVSLGLLQLQQYSLRTSTRFFYAALVLLGFLSFVAFLLKTHAAGKPVAQVLNILIKPSMLRMQDGRARKRSPHFRDTVPVKS